MWLTNLLSPYYVANHVEYINNGFLIVSISSDGIVIIDHHVVRAGTASATVESIPFEASISLMAFVRNEAVAPGRLVRLSLTYSLIIPFTRTLPI